MKSLSYSTGARRCYTYKDDGSLWGETIAASGQYDRVVGSQYEGPLQIGSIHEFARSIMRRFPAGCGYINSSSKWSGYNIGGAPSVSISDPSEFSMVYNQCLDSLNEEVRGSLDLSIDAFQLGATADLGRYLSRSTKEISKFLRGIRHQPIKEISARYLELIYGVKPTLQSLFDIYGRIYQGGMSNPIRMRKRATSLSQFTMAGRGIAPYGLGGEVCQFNTRFERSTRCEIQIQLKLRNLSQLQELAGFTSLNPASIIWELTPYSFVVDWFWDLGGCIRNFETAMVYGDLFDKGYYTHTAKVTGFDEDFVAKGSWVLMNPEPGSFEGTYLYRKPLTSYPLPRRPVVKLDLSSTQLLNAAALLGNLLPRRTLHK